MMNISQKIERFIKALQLNKDGDTIRAEISEEILGFYNENFEEINFIDKEIFREIFDSYRGLSKSSFSNTNMVDNYLNRVLVREVKYIYITKTSITLQQHANYLN